MPKNKKGVRKEQDYIDVKLLIPPDKEISYRITSSAIQKLIYFLEELKISKDEIDQQVR